MRAALTTLLVAVASCHPTAGPASAPRHGAELELTEVAPDAAPLLDAWAKAIGGREAIEKLGGWHAKGTYRRGGVDGTIEVFQSPHGARRQVIVQGFLREERVFALGGGWLVDRNGEVRRLAGFEQDDELADTFLGAWGPLVRTRMRGGVTLDAAGKLVLTVDGGHRPDTVTLDATTKLPVTSVRRDGEKLRTTTYGEWREVAGVRMPFRVIEDNGNPNDTETIAWTTIERANLDDKTFARPAERTPDMTVVGNPVEVPIEIVYGGLIFVKVTVNGTPMSMIFDTGAEVTVLNSSRLPKLGLEGFGHFATGAGGGDVELAYVKGVTTQIGGATAKDQIVAAIMLDPLEGPLRRPLDGILGYDFISRFAIEIDYPHSTMRLFDRATYQHAGSGEMQRMSLEDSTPFMNAWVHLPEGKPVRGHFVLDTGCLCDVQLFSPFVDKHQLLEVLPEARKIGYSAGAGGQTNQVTTTVPALQIGHLRIDNPRADLSRDEHGATADPESAGLIGGLTLGRYVLVLDYKNERFYLDPPGAP